VIESKLITIGSCGFHYLVAKELVTFSHQLSYLSSQAKFPIVRASNETGVGKDGEEMQRFFINKSCVGNNRR